MMRLRCLIALTLSALASGAFGDETRAPLDAAPLEISRALFEDYLVWQGVDVERLTPETQRARLDSLAYLLRLEDEAIRGGTTPRLELELRVQERQLLAAAERRRHLDSTSVSEEAIERRLAELRETVGLRKPTRIQLSHFFRRAPAEAGEVERRRLRLEVESLRQRVLAGEDFEQIARAESDSQSARRGGRLGIVRPGQLPPALETIAFALEAGEVSEVLETRQGFVMLYCRRVMASEAIPAAERRERVRSRLERLAKEESLRALRAEALDAASAEIDLTALGAGDRSATVLRAKTPKIQLTAADLGILTRLSPGSPSAERLGSEGLRRLLEDYVVTSVLAARALERPRDAEMERRRRWTARKVRADAGLRRRVAAVFEPPTERELRAYVAAHPQRFERREHFRLQVLRLEAGDEEQAHQALAMAHAIEAGELDFERAARRHSEHPSAPDGGHVGWWSRKRLALHGGFILAAVVELEPGQMTQPILEDRAWWILKLLAKEPARPMTFEEARERADRFLGNEKLQRVQRRVEAELRGLPFTLESGTPESQAAPR